MAYNHVIYDWERRNDIQYDLILPTVVTRFGFNQQKGFADIATSYAHRKSFTNIINEKYTDMPRAAKKLDFDDVTALVAVLGAIGAQARKTPLTKPQVAELTGLPAVQTTASYKTLIRKELAERIDPPADMPPKGVYLKITPKGKAYCKAYNLLFA